jgi:hypothetical protein
VIVDPDFVDHWRTGMVADALQDLMAPVYILRLWAHCQERKADTFVMPTRGLKAQCKFPGDAETFEAALIEAGFIERRDDTVYVIGWAEKNASLLAAWSNGSKGGRPRKEPMGNPSVTQRQPDENPGETDKSREDKSSSTSLRSVRKRGERACPEAFTVTDEMRQWAAEKAPRADIERETEKFRDWEFKDAKTDWPKAWRTWMRRASDDGAAKATPTETAYQRSQREKYQQVTPAIAAKSPGVAGSTNVMEILDASVALIGR